MPYIIYSKLCLLDSLMFKYIVVVHPVAQLYNKSSFKVTTKYPFYS